MKKILIVQTAFLGDVILATPVVSELNRLFPESTIDVLVKNGNQSLLANNSKLNKVHVFNKKNGKWKSIVSYIRLFRKEKYDLVINLHRFGSSGIISGLSGGKKRYGFSKNPFSFLYTKSFDHQIGDGTHEVERNLSIIKEFGGNKKLRPELFPSPQDIETVQTIVSKLYYCIAPASVWFTKQLPKEKWIELIDKLDSKNEVFLIGGPSDKDLCASIIESLTKPMSIKNLCGELTLLQSAELMRRAERCFVNDSGPLHLASSVNAKVTAYFCSTIPDFGFGPLSDDSEIKETPGLNCRPCGLHGRKSCPEGHFNCALKIEV